METKRFKLKKLLLKILFNKEAFCRMDIVIKYFAFEKWKKEGVIDPYYSRMQFDKLKSLNSFNYDSIINQINRFLKFDKILKESINNVESIVIGNNFKLIDGSHRISLYTLLAIDEIEVKISDTKGYVGSWNDSYLQRLFTKPEQSIIEDRKDKLLEKIEVLK